MSIHFIPTLLINDVFLFLSVFCLCLFPCLLYGVSLTLFCFCCCFVILLQSDQRARIILRYSASDALSVGDAVVSMVSKM